MRPAGSSSVRSLGRALALVACAVVLVIGCSGDSTTHRAGGSSGTASTPDDRSSASAARIKDSALHARHANAKPGIKCTGCHELVGGQYLRAKSWPCQQCHIKDSLQLHAAAPADSPARECWSCHDFKGKSDKATPCASCHAQAVGALKAIGPHDAKKPDEDCQGCHRPHETPSLNVARCEDCHKEPVSGHAEPGIPITGCHSCHGYHEKAEVASTRCTGCHHQSRATVPVTATFAGGHVKCVTCHRPHRFFKTEVIGCRDECHQKQVAISEKKVKEHRCLGCHNNHDVMGSPQTSCLKCHGGKVNPTHPKDPVSKTPCIGCHKPHLGPGAPLAVACSSCHKKAASDRAFHQGADKGGPECRNCHKPHDFDLKGRGTTVCMGCHGEQPFKGAKTIRPYEKHSNCFQCHGETVRHEPAGPRVACTSCHKDKAGLVRKGHATCTNCHDPHTTKQKNPCGKCHAAEASIARKDHKTCTNCHNPHSGQQKRVCGSCHTDEAATAPPKHQTCLNCHDQHSTLVKKQCGECHTDRTTGVHAPVKGGCINCHRPHGPNGQPAPPPCTTCHKGLTMLHQVPQHADCKNCHRSHGEQPNKRRETCIACHKDKKDHEPSAPMCFGCHTFGGPQ